MEENDDTNQEQEGDRHNYWIDFAISAVVTFVLETIFG